MKRAFAALQFAAPFIAIIALALSLVGLFTQTQAKHVELDHALAMRRNQLEQHLAWIEPHEINHAAELHRSIETFKKWQHDWQEFTAAYRAYGALTSEIRRGEADVFDNLQTSLARRKELELKTIATQSIKPPTPESQVILTAEEVIQLATTLIDTGWAKDINLAALLEERASWEEARDPGGAATLRELAKPVGDTK